jgi:hypothetical protein
MTNAPPALGSAALHWQNICSSDVNFLTQIAYDMNGSNQSFVRNRTNGTWSPWAAMTAAQIQSDWKQNNTASLDFIKNKPLIPTATSQLINDSNFVQATGGKIPASVIPATTATASSAQLENGVPFDAVTFPMPDGAVVGGIVNYCVLVRNATDTQLTCGLSTFECINTGGTTVIGAASDGLQTQQLTSGTELVGVNVKTDAGACSWKINSHSSLAGITVHQLTIDVHPIVGGISFTLQ